MRFLHNVHVKLPDRRVGELTSDELNLKTGHKVACSSSIVRLVLFIGTDGLHVESIWSVTIFRFDI